MTLIPLVLTTLLFSPFTVVNEVCVTVETHRMGAAKHGYTNDVSLKGDDAKRWMLAYAAHLKVDPSDVLDLDSLSFFTNPADTSIVVVLAFKNGCYVGAATFPAEEFKTIQELYQKGAKGGRGA